MMIQTWQSQEFFVILEQVFQGNGGRVRNADNNWPAKPSKKMCFAIFFYVRPIRALAQPFGKPEELWNHVDLYLAFQILDHFSCVSLVECAGTAVWFF